MEKKIEMGKTAVYIALALALLSCSDDVVGPGEQPEPVVIGMIADTTNAAERAYYHAAKTAVVIINQLGGVMENRQLALVVEPGGGNAGSAIDRLLGNTNLAAILTCGSADSYAAAEQVNNGRNVTLVSGRALSDQLSGVSLWFHRLVPSALFLGQAYADQASELGVYRISIAMEEGDTENEDLVKRFMEFHPGDFTTVMLPASQEVSGDAVHKLFENSPEAVFFAISNETLLTSLLGHSNMKATNSVYYLLSSNLRTSVLSMNEADVLVGTINNHPRTIGITPAGDYGSRAYTYFAPEIEYRTGELPVPFTPHYFDAVFLLALSIERAWQDSDLENIATFRNVMNQNIRAIADMKPDDLDVDPVDRWNTIREEVANETVNYTGASGGCEINAAGNTLCPLEVWTVTETNEGLQYQTISMLYQ